MRNYSSILFCVGVWTLASCSPKVTSNIIHSYPQLESPDQMAVFKDKELLPADADWMGSVKVEGKASYDKMADISRFTAWKAGGSYLKIKDYSASGLRSDIHVMNSDVYRADTTKVVYENKSNSYKPYTASAGVTGSTMVYNNPNNTQFSVEIDTLFHNVFRFYAGYGRRLGKLSPDLKTQFEREHYKRLLNGVVLGADYVYLFKSGSGFGLRFRTMRSSTTDAVTVLYDDGSMKDGLWEQTVYISFLGPLYSGRMVSKNGKHIFMDNVGLGVIFYNDNSNILSQKEIISGSSLGFTFDINYSYLISDHLSIGADVSYTSGTIKMVSVSDGNRSEAVKLDKDHYEGMAHLGICAQLVYSF